MIKQPRRKFSPEFKAKVAGEKVIDQLILADLSKKFEAGQEVGSRRESEFLSGITAVFQTRPEPEGEKVDIEKLLAPIGQIEMENDF